MGQLNSKPKIHTRVAAGQQCRTANAEGRGKRTGARWPGSGFGFGRDRVKQISLKPEKAKLACFPTNTNENQSIVTRVQKVFLCCLSFPDEDLDSTQPERLSSASCENIDQDKVTDVVDPVCSRDHLLQSNTGFSQDDYDFLFNWFEDAESSTSFDVLMVHADKISNTTFDIHHPDALSMEVDTVSVTNEGTSVWVEEDEAASAHMDGDGVSNATYDVNSVDALLDEAEAMLDREQNRSTGEGHLNTCSRNSVDALLDEAEAMLDREQNCSTDEGHLDTCSRNSVDSLLDEIEDMLARQEGGW